MKQEIDYRAIATELFKNPREDFMSAIIEEHAKYNEIKGVMFYHNLKKEVANEQRASEFPDWSKFIYDYCNKRIKELTTNNLKTNKPEPTLDAIYESDEALSQLPDSHFPTIDQSLLKPKWIYETYNNKAFSCTEKAFNAWLVYGKIYTDEQIKWLLISRNGKKNLAQLKKFIHEITNSDNAKEKYFMGVFGEKVTSDIRESPSFYKELKEIGTEKVSIKLGIRK